MEVSIMLWPHGCNQIALAESTCSFCVTSSFFILVLSTHFSPQFKRKSTEGVSYFLFALVILGNTTYGLSVLLKNPEEGQGEKSYLIHHLPWLIGSLGTLSLDIFVSFNENMAAALGPLALLNPTCMLHFRQCWANREDTDGVWGNTICCCSVKSPNTDGKPGCSQQRNRSFLLHPTKVVDLMVCQLHRNLTLTDIHIEEADGPREGFYWTLIWPLKVITQLCSHRPWAAVPLQGTDN